MNINDLIGRIAGRKNTLFENDFLLTWEKSTDELQNILDVAETLRKLRNSGISTRCFDSGLAISQFRDQSTRTRFSFASAADLLGLSVQDLDEGKSQISHGETVRETSVMVSFLSEVIGIRDDMYLGAGHTYMKEVAAALEQGYSEEVLPARPAVVNLQCDLDHPTQSMSDLLHMVNEYGSLEELKSKKIVMSWAYSPSYGKPLSVPQGVIGLMTRMGMNVVLAYPPGYELVSDIAALADRQANESGGTFEHVTDMAEAFEGADIVYPKSWAPYHVMERRTELLKASDRTGLAELEQECLANNAKYRDWTCERPLMDLTRDKKALYMHCLPADITGVSCKEGEVSEEVFEQYRVPLYRQAGYKPYIIAAMILCSRFSDPGKLLAGINDAAVLRQKS